MKKNAVIPLVFGFISFCITLFICLSIRSCILSADAITLNTSNNFVYFDNVTDKIYIEKVSNDDFKPNDDSIQNEVSCINSYEANSANTEDIIVTEEEIYQPEVYSETEYDSYQDCYEYNEEYISDTDFRTSGVVYDDNGTRYTWYSQNVLPGGGLTDLNENGRSVNSEGYVIDGDGYIAVASSDYEKGTVLDTPFGEAKVYDTGCPSGTVDVYTDF